MVTPPKAATPTHSPPVSTTQQGTPLTAVATATTAMADQQRQSEGVPSGQNSGGLLSNIMTRDVHQNRHVSPRTVDATSPIQQQQQQQQALSYLSSTIRPPFLPVSLSSGAPIVHTTTNGPLSSAQYHLPPQQHDPPLSHPLPHPSGHVTIGTQSASPQRQPGSSVPSLAAHIGSCQPTVVPAPPPPLSSVSRLTSIAQQQGDYQAAMELEMWKMTQEQVFMQQLK